jgi:hypothetical protein
MILGLNKRNIKAKKIRKIKSKLVNGFYSDSYNLFSKKLKEFNKLKNTKTYFKIFLIKSIYLEKYNKIDLLIELREDIIDNDVLEVVIHSGNDSLFDKLFNKSSITESCKINLLGSIIYYEKDNMFSTVMNSIDMVKSNEILKKVSFENISPYFLEEIIKKTKINNEKWLSLLENIIYRGNIYYINKVLEKINKIENPDYLLRVAISMDNTEIIEMFFNNNKINITRERYIDLISSSIYRKKEKELNYLLNKNSYKLTRKEIISLLSISVYVENESIILSLLSLDNFNITQNELKDLFYSSEYSFNRKLYIANNLINVFLSNSIMRLKIKECDYDYYSEVMNKNTKTKLDNF